MTVTLNVGQASLLDYQILQFVDNQGWLSHLDVSQAIPAKPNCLTAVDNQGWLSHSTKKPLD